MYKFLKILLSILVLYTVGFMIAEPQSGLDAAQNALSVCAKVVVPVLFPFFVCGGLLSALGFTTLCSHFLSPLMRPLFNLPGCAAVTFLLGILSGYPIGAANAATLYASGNCTKAEAERMLAFCNNSGSLFVIGVVGCNYLHNPLLGKYLYAVHILSAIITGILFGFFGKTTEESTRALPTSVPDKKSAFLSVGEIIDNSVFSILKVCGFVVFFAVFTSTLPKNPFLYPFIEIVGGLRVLSEYASSATLPLLSFFLAFSGLSVMLQVAALTSPLGLSLKPYIAGKLTQGVISFFLTFLLIRLFPPAEHTFFQDSIETLFSLSPFSAVLASLTNVFLVVLVLTVVCIFYSIPKKKHTKKRPL